MIHADLHIHTQYSSDGEFSVDKIISKCIDHEVNLFALTDHNSVRGIGEAINSIQSFKLKFVPGIEIDCNYKGTDLHVLGYNIDWTSEDFQRLEADISSKVTDSFVEMINNLRKLGFIIDKNSVLSKAEGKLPTGELIAEVMLSNEKYYTPLLSPYIQGGKRADMPYINFYLDYFAQGKPAFVPIKYMDYKDAIEMIKDNGGLPIVAHPGLNLKGKEFIVEELLKNGAAGLEAFNNYHNADQIDYFAVLVQQQNKIMTCGSDFHGKTKPLIHIGQYKLNNRFESYLNNSLQQINNLTNF